MLVHPFAPRRPSRFDAALRLATSAFALPGSCGPHAHGAVTLSARGPTDALSSILTGSRHEQVLASRDRRQRGGVRRTNAHDARSTARCCSMHAICDAAWTERECHGLVARTRGGRITRPPGADGTLRPHQVQCQPPTSIRVHFHPRRRSVFKAL